MMVNSAPPPPAAAAATAAAGASTAAQAAYSSGSSASALRSGASSAAAPSSSSSSVMYGGKVRVALAHILRTEGVRGLYSGFGVTMGGLTIGPLYMFVLLSTKEKLEKMAAAYQHTTPGATAAYAHAMTAAGSSAAAGSVAGASSLASASSNSSVSASTSSSSSLLHRAIPFVSGASASCVAQVLGVPLDVVSAKQMRGPPPTPTTATATATAAATESAPPPPRNKPAFEIAKKVWATQGIKGFYKGERERAREREKRNVCTFVASPQ